MPTEIGLEQSVAWLRGSGDGKTIVVHVHEGPIDPKSGLDRWLGKGEADADVVLLNPRGMATAPPSGKPRYFSHDFGDAMLSLHLDRPLLGQRVGDVLAVLDHLPADAEIRLVAKGKCGPIALHAAALSDRVASLHLADSLTSWENVTRTPASVDQIANVVPGALQSYDLPHLLLMMGNRPVVLERPTDAAGRALTRDEADSVYEPARRRGAKLTVQPAS